MKEPRFFTLAEALEIHADQIRRYGGSPGVRDQGMLQSALGQPSAGFGDEYLHKDIFEMAGAHAYHLAGNHPFVDGNKRTALACALVFLDLNGITIVDPRGRLYGAMMKTAQGQMSKLEWAVLFGQLKRGKKMDP